MGQRRKIGIGAAITAALVAGALVAPRPASAQTVDTWVSAFSGLYMDPGTVLDDEVGPDHPNGTEWDLGSSVLFGVGLHRLFGQTLVAGVDLTYSPIKHEVRDAITNVVLADGRAHLLTAMVNGRLGGGGGGGFQTYLTGGLGTMVYGIPYLERWDPDLALQGGGGLNYSHSRTLAFFLEWNRWWVFHQTEGVDDNTLNHSHIEIGVRYGM